MTYRPGQLVYVDRRWPLKADAVKADVGEALVVAVLPGPVREVVKHTRFGSESKKDSRGTALMLLPDGQYEWIKSDSGYTRVTSE